MDSDFTEGPQKARTITAAQFYRRVEWRKYVKSVKTIGVKDVKGKPAYEVQVTPKDGKAFSQFYNKKSGRLVKYVRTAKSKEAGDVGMEVFLSDYRQFDGVWIATKVTQMLDSSSFGKGTQTWTYDKIEHNVKIPKSLFAMPEGLKDTKVK